MGSFAFIANRTEPNKTFSKISCDCSSIAYVQEHFALADAVFAGTVISTSELLTNTTRTAVTFQVVSAWKGVSDEHYTISTRTGSSCGHHPRVGESWLVFSKTVDGDGPFMGFCGQDALLGTGYSKENLDYLGPAKWGASSVPAQLLEPGKNYLRQLTSQPGFQVSDEITIYTTLAVLSGLFIIYIVWLHKNYLRRVNKDQKSPTTSP